MKGPTRAIQYDVRDQWPTPHLDQTIKTWSRVRALSKIGSFSLDGQSLDVASVIALSRFGCEMLSIKDGDVIANRMDDSVETLNKYLSNGYFLYGVNTGFGGSADTRTADLPGLQRALMQLAQTAILTGEDKSSSPSSHEYLESHSMPNAWTRATILIRCNANIRGHSAISRKTVDAMFQIMQHDIVPIIPLRGSISASGDLMPLSYIAGAIQGNPDVYVRVGSKTGTTRVTTAERALKEASIEPIVLGPKEGLALINGTAAATAVATLGLHEAHQLAVTSQLLTALTAEALNANAEWAHPFIAAVRPHSGQIEAAQNLRTFLRGSRLIHGLEQTKDRFKPGMAQDRYALRSAPQWLSPQLEDLASAERQLVTELNSTADNPVVNVVDNDIHCGANFQSASVTSATEKVRLALQSIGRILFAQVTEMINHTLNNGLPPNLAADDPSVSFCLKGIDVNTAAYTSELGFLANPVSNHVQTAEMHNQAINSLGLLSARQTMAAVEVLSMIVANSLYTGCQGVDLRTLHRTFLEQVKLPIRKFVSSFIMDWEVSESLFTTLWKLFEEAWYGNAGLDAVDRCEKASETLATAIVTHMESLGGLAIETVAELRKTFSSMILGSYCQHRDAFFKNPTTPDYLGEGTRAIYMFVRQHLGVPMHRGLVEHPVAGDPSGNLIDGRPKKTIGSWVSIIYESIRDGSFYSELLGFMESNKAILSHKNANGHVNGVNEPNYTNGHKQVNGMNGINGHTHSNGVNGANGHVYTNGVNKSNGISGTNGHSYTNGLNGNTHLNGVSRINGNTYTNGHNQVNGHAYTNGHVDTNGHTYTNGH